MNITWDLDKSHKRYCDGSYSKQRHTSVDADFSDAKIHYANNILCPDAVLMKHGSNERSF